MVNSADAALLLLLLRLRRRGGRLVCGKSKPPMRTPCSRNRWPGRRSVPRRKKDSDGKKKDVSELYMRDEGRMTVVR